MRINEEIVDLHERDKLDLEERVIAVKLMILMLTRKLMYIRFFLKKYSNCVAGLVQLSMDPSLFAQMH